MTYNLNQLFFVKMTLLTINEMGLFHEKKKPNIYSYEMYI